MEKKTTKNSGPFIPPNITIGEQWTACFRLNLEYEQFIKTVTESRNYVDSFVFY